MKYSTTKYPCGNSLKYINLIFRLSFWIRRLYTQVFFRWGKSYALPIFRTSTWKQSIYIQVYVYAYEGTSFLKKFHITVHVLIYPCVCSHKRSLWHTFTLSLSPPSISFPPNTHAHIYAHTLSLSHTHVRKRGNAHVPTQSGLENQGDEVRVIFTFREHEQAGRAGGRKRHLLVLSSNSFSILRVCTCIACMYTHIHRHIRTCMHTDTYIRILTCIHKCIQGATRGIFGLVGPWGDPWCRSEWDFDVCVYVWRGRIMWVTWHDSQGDPWYILSSLCIDACVYLWHDLFVCVTHEETFDEVLKELFTCVFMRDVIESCMGHGMTNKETRGVFWVGCV